MRVNDGSDATFRRETHVGVVVGGLYNCNDLSVIPATRTDPIGLASMVQGFANVEVLRLQPAGGIEVKTVSGPPENCTHVPVSISVMDVNGDARKDIVVLDLWRAWVGLDDGDGGYLVRPLDDFVAGLPIAINSAKASGPDGTDFLITGAYAWARVDAFSQSLLDAGSLMNYLELPSYQCLNVPVSSPFLSLPGQNGGGDQLLLQGQAVIALSGLSASASGIATSQTHILALGAVEPPYLEPFDGLDHLQLARVAGCPDMALAIGVFRKAVKGVSRQLQLVTFSTDKYLTHEIATPFSVSTFGITAVADGRVFVGMVGKDAQGDVFGLAEMLGCGKVNSIGSWPTTFDWRTPDAPAFLDLGQTVPKTDGIRLLGQTDTVGGHGERLIFTNYDGYIMRTWSIFLDAFDAGNIMPTLQTTTIHEERKDLAYVN